MKKVQMFRQMEEFENFVNRQDIKIISTDLKVVEQSAYFQEGFCALIFYDELVDIVSEREEKKAEMDNAGNDNFY